MAFLENDNYILGNAKMIDTLSSPKPGQNDPKTAIFIKKGGKTIVKAKNCAPQFENYGLQFQNYATQSENYGPRFSNYNPQFQNCGTRFENYTAQFENYGL
jgi:hypothetical protein